MIAFEANMPSVLWQLAHIVAYLLVYKLSAVILWLCSFDPPKEQLQYGCFEDSTSRVAMHDAWEALHFYALPEWLKNNEFLHQGHRPPLQSYQACLRSIFRLHIETGNIWSHLLGCLMFLATAVYFLSQTKLALMDQLVYGCFFVSVVACLGLSSAYHTFNCHSQAVCVLFSKLDYAGIAMLISCSFSQWVYYGFYCYPQLRNAYIGVYCFTGLLTAILFLYDHLKEPHWRALYFSSFGLTGIIPGLHMAMLEHWPQNGGQQGMSVRVSSLCYLLCMAAAYLIGVCLYALRLPERLFPGKCDLWFQSHQMFHLLVVIGAIIHFYGVSNLTNYRLTATNQCQAARDHCTTNHNQRCS